MRRTRAFGIGVVAVVSLAAGIAVSNSADAVFYGGPTNAASAPFMVALVDANKANGYQAQFCGGQYVDTHWVLTAAHCVSLPAKRIQAVSGVTNLSAIKPTDRRKIVQKIVHPNYDSLQFIHDVALLRLAQPVPASWVLPLNTNPTLPTAGTTMTVYGWGLTDKGWTDELRSGNVRNVQSPNGACGAYPTEYLSGRGPAFVPSHEICALGPLPGETTKSVDACYGDSGGPLVTATPAGPRLTGTVAWGKYCGLGLNAKSPGVYMRTSAYAPWIQQVIATTPRVSLVDASVTEGNPANGNKTIKFTVSLDRPVGEVVRVDYTTFNGSAGAGTDYRAETGTIAIPANATTKALAITVISDRVREGTEQFGVALSNPRIAKMGRGGAIGTILDND